MCIDFRDHVDLCVVDISLGGFPIPFVQLQLVGRAGVASHRSSVDGLDRRNGCRMGIDFSGKICYTSSQQSGVKCEPSVRRLTSSIKSSLTRIRQLPLFGCG